MTTAKRIISVFLLTLFLLLPGCSPAQTVTCYAEPTAEPEPEISTVTQTVRVIAVYEGGSLLLADMDSNSIYSNALPDGKSYPAGTLLELTCADYVLETYPEQLAKIQSATPIEDGFDDRCALYLQVLEDLWEEDPALQADIEYIGIDLSGTSLTQSEQDAVAWRFGELKEKEIVQGTFDELCEEGFIDRENLYWEDGCLLSITEEDATADSVNFSAEKWRSGLGAILFTDCTAKQNSAGHWGDYSAGGFLIA